jgi:hypothetical protein
MSLSEKIHQDMIASMKAHDAERTSTLRMAKTAIKNKEIDNRAPLSDAEVLQVMTTMIKQRRDSIEQFTKGNRPELAAKEAAEIELLETYMPKAVGAGEIQTLIAGVVAEIAANGAKPTAKDMGAVIKAVQAKIQAAGLRAEGRQVSELVKAELAK